MSFVCLLFRSVASTSKADVDSARHCVKKRSYTVLRMRKIQILDRIFQLLNGMWQWGHRTKSSFELVPKVSDR